MTYDDIILRIMQTEHVLCLTEEAYKAMKRNHDFLIENHMTLVEGHAKMLEEWDTKESTHRETVSALNKKIADLKQNLECSSRHVADLKKERCNMQIWHNDIVCKNNEAIKKLREENAELRNLYTETLKDYFKLKDDVESHNAIVARTKSYWDMINYDTIPAPKIVWFPTPNASEEEINKIKEELRERIKNAYERMLFDFNNFDCQNVISEYKKTILPWVLYPEGTVLRGKYKGITLGELLFMNGCDTPVGRKIYSVQNNILIGGIRWDCIEENMRD